MTIWIKNILLYNLLYLCYLLVYNFIVEWLTFNSSDMLEKPKHHVFHGMWYSNDHLDIKFSNIQPDIQSIDCTTFVRSTCMHVHGSKMHLFIGNAISLSLTISFIFNISSVAYCVPDSNLTPPHRKAGMLFLTHSPPNGCLG